MIKYICDRCGEEIDENYYTCSFGCMSDKKGMITAAGGTLNMAENMRQNRMLCYECMEEIRNFTDKKINRLHKKGEYNGRENKKNITESPKRDNSSVFRWLY